MTRISNEQLSAFLDGELSGEERARVENALRADPDLAARLEALRASDQQLREAFSPALVEPVPDRIAAILEPRPDQAPLKPGRRGFSIRPEQLAALAASFIAGLVLAGLLLNGRASPGFIAGPGGRLMASLEVGKALDVARAGEGVAVAGERLSVHVSFEDGAGRLCREFQLRSVAGLACKSGADWAVEALASHAPQGEPGGYAMAGAGAIAEIEAARLRLGVGRLLDADEEARAIKSGWARKTP